MADLVDVISSEFEDAMEVRNAKSLHRGVFLLVSSMVKKEEHVQEHADLISSIKLIATRMEEGFGSSGFVMDTGLICRNKRELKSGNS